MASSSDVNDNNTSIEEVEEILEKRMRGLRVEYLVKWKMGKHNKGPSEEWVRASECSCPKAIAEFDKSQGNWEPEYEVEGIIDSIGEGDKMEYLVKWKGFDFSENSWVKKADMHCNALLKEFKKGKVYEDENLPPVKKIIKSIIIKKVQHFRVEWENDEDADDEYYSIDYIYSLPNGRKALVEFLNEDI